MKHNYKIFLFLLPVSMILSACSGAASENVPQPDITPFVLPTSLATPASLPGQAHAQETNQTVEAYQDFWVGGIWGFQLHQGEKALLDVNDKVLEILDAQGQVKLENLGEDWYRYYARQDSYDVIVGSGYLALSAGYSYTFEWSARKGNPRQIAVRQMSNDQLAGYALIIQSYDQGGAFTGYETLIPFVDRNKDGLASPQELVVAINDLKLNIAGFTEESPIHASQLEESLASAESALLNGSMADAYQLIQQIQDKASAAAHNANPPVKLDRQDSFLIVLIILVFMMIVAAILIGVRRRPARPVQQVNHPQRRSNRPAAPERGIAQPGQVKRPEIASDSTARICPKCAYSTSFSNDLFCIKCVEKLDQN